MARREKFDRSDVPEASVHRTVLSLVALVVVGVLTVLLVRTIWTRAHLDDRLNDDALNAALGNQQATQYWDNNYPSGKDLETVLLIEVDGDVTTSTTLTGLSLVVINRTDGTGTIVDIPLDTRVMTEGAKLTVASALPALGEAKFIEVLSAFTNLPADHIIVASRDVMPDIEAIKTFGPLNTITSRLLQSIRTDMRSKTFVTFAGEVTAIGLDNFQLMEAPRWHEDPVEGEEGVPEGGWQIIGMTDLCYAVGKFSDVDPNAVPEETPEETAEAEAVPEG